MTGLYNIHHGVLVKDENYTYQVYELSSWKNRISKKLQKFPIETAIELHEQIKNSNALKSGMNYFPVYHFPDDAWFVIKLSALDNFINTIYPSSHTEPSKISSRITTPLSRLLWLACRHNQDISSLIEQPYKLISIFEEWAKSDGISERLNGDTLKTALERGSPLPTSASSNLKT